MREFPIDRDTLAELGLVMVRAAQIEFQVSCINRLLRAPEKNRFPDKYDAMRRAIRSLNRVDATTLLEELIWAMNGAIRARDLVGHGICLRADDGTISFFSPDKHHEMTLDEVADFAPKLGYALACVVQMNWLLMGIKPPKPLPERP